MQSTKHSLLFYVIIPYDQAPLICISLILKTYLFPMYVPARESHRLIQQGFGGWSSVGVLTALKTLLNKITAPQKALSCLGIRSKGNLC